MNQIFNFSAGPAMLPTEVLHHAEKELCNWQGLGTSVMEMSHRGKEFIRVAEESEADFRELLQIPNNYKVLFCHGGARGQFSAVPMNLLNKKHTADYVDSGYWSASAAVEAQRYCTANVVKIATCEEGKRGVKPMSQWELNQDSAYVHYCPNETIEGIAIHEQPNFADQIVVADCSSTLLSRPLDVSRYGVIYAGAQKNIGPAGITLVIVRDDLLGKSRADIPSIFDYDIAAKYDSMFNTPSTYPWYLSGLVFKWLKEKGGLIAMEQRNRAKAEHLYGFIDNSDFYYNAVATENRSWMNVPFNLVNTALDSLFLDESYEAGLRALKGHKAVGGMRASIYNAMPLEGVKALTQFMADFERRHG